MARYLATSNSNVIGLNNSIINLTPAWQPDADMQWAKGVCENDTQAGFTYKVLQMISDGYVYTDIEVPSGGAVKTSDGGYYTANAKHIWNDADARVAEASYNLGLKLRWLIYYYPRETPTITSLNDVMYSCLDGVKFGRIFSNRRMLAYFDIINGANLASNITNANYMFQNCYSLQTIPLLDTSNVTNTQYMFHSCYSLQTIPLLDTSSVTTMSVMFGGCYSLETIPLLDTSNVTDMQSMLGGCYSLETIPLLDTSNVTNMNNMFSSCSSLQTIPLLNSSNVTNMFQMFYSCQSLQTIPLLNTSNVTDMHDMFYNCSSLQTIPLLDTSNVTNMQGMFYNCYTLQTIQLLNTSNVTTMNTMFGSCSYLEFLSLENIGVNFSISSSTKFSQETLVNLIANLKDLTGGTAQTFTMGTTNKNKLTAAQIAVATAKNWSVA